MDRFNQPRPDIQKQRQIIKNSFGSSLDVPKAIQTRPSSMAQLAGRLATNQPLIRPRPTSRRLVTDIARPRAIIPERQRLNLAGSQAGRPLETKAALKQTAAVSTNNIDTYTPPEKLLATVSKPPKSGPLDMALPGETSQLKVAKFKQWRKARLAVSRGMAVALVLVITLGGLLFSQSYLRLHQIFKGSSGTAAALNTNVKPELLKGEGSGRVNILLLGRGGGNHDAPDLTDTLMIASIDPVNHTTALISVPRDLWVNVPGQGVMKINAAWQSGEFKYLGKNITGSTNPQAIQAGYSSVDQSIKDVLGIDVHYHILVDFQAFKQLVDSVGGVNVNVPTDLVDPTMAWENHNNPVLAKAGPQVFDGTKALIYARSRETSSDFARGERQRSLLMAIKTKAVSIGTLSNPIKVTGLLKAFGNNVQTDLSLSNANRLFKIIRNINDANVTSLSLADAAHPLVTTGVINGQSVVIPKAGLYKYADIQDYVHGQLIDPYIAREKAKIWVLNGTQIPGLAATKANELKSYGYNVIGTGNTPTNGWTTTTLVDLTHKNKYTKHFLELRFNQTASATLSDSTIPTNGADFVIIVGNDGNTTAQAAAN